MQFNILIIGLGNIGLRHLEGALKLKCKLNFFLIDTSLKAIENSKTLVKKKNTNLKSVFLYSNIIINFNEIIDCAIIATTADIRFKITNDLLNKNKITNKKIEKVLFNNIKEYKQILNRTKTNKIKTYVNYPRKFMPDYHHLKKKLINQKIISIKICGFGWGLASNIFHFLDIFVFLVGDKNFYLYKNNLSKKLFKSKRNKFLEARGELVFKTLGNYKLTCIDDKNYIANFLKIETENFVILVDEAKNTINKTYFKEVNKSKIEKFNFLYQSEITGQYIDYIINKKKLSLSSLEESYFGFNLIMSTMNQHYKTKKILIT